MLKLAVTVILCFGLGWVAAGCTTPLAPYVVPEQCKVDIINGQPYQRPGWEDCRIASDGSGRIVLRG